MVPWEACKVSSSESELYSTCTVLCITCLSWLSLLLIVQGSAHVCLMYYYFTLIWLSPKRVSLYHTHNSCNYAQCNPLHGIQIIKINYTIRISILQTIYYYIIYCAQ